MPPVKGPNKFQILLHQYLRHDDVRFQLADGFQSLSGAVRLTAYDEIGRSV
jgi:hypothetical protein